MFTIRSIKNMTGLLAFTAFIATAQAIPAENTSIQEDLTAISTRFKSIGRKAAINVMTTSSNLQASINRGLNSLKAMGKKKTNYAVRMVKCALKSSNYNCSVQETKRARLWVSAVALPIVLAAATLAGIVITEGVYETIMLYRWEKSAKMGNYTTSEAIINKVVRMVSISPQMSYSDIGLTVNIRPDLGNALKINVISNNTEFDFAALENALTTEIKRTYPYLKSFSYDFKTPSAFRSSTTTLREDTPVYHQLPELTEPRKPATLRLDAEGQG